MKRIISLMLGMSLVFGAASFAFAQDNGSSQTDKKSKKKGHKKKGDDKKSDSTKN